jgi:predicted transcriptional regulator
MNTLCKPLMSLCASDIMSRMITLIPRKMSLQGAARILARAGITGAPIIDDSGRCVGVLSATDFMHAVEKDTTATEKPSDARSALAQPWQIPTCGPGTNLCVEDYMTKDPVLVAPTVHIGDLARMMIDAHIHRIIVIDPVSQTPCGIVSSMDILAALARVHQTSRATEDDMNAEIFEGAFH